MGNRAADGELEFHHSFEVNASVEHAFNVFADGLVTWWPQEYTWSKDVLELIAIEPREGGRCFERGPHNFQCDWGRVLAWEPPWRLVFTWQISPGREPEPDPEKASEVEVRFEPDGPSKTRVQFTHRQLQRHGASGEHYKASLASPQGWPHILGRYAGMVH